MGKEIYHHHMEQRLRDLSIQIGSVRARLGSGADERLKDELAGRLAVLERRRDHVHEKLEALEQEPDGTWEDLKAEIEDEWDALVQDFEERVSNLV